MREKGDEDEDEDVVNVPTVSHAQACKSFETILVYLEQQPGVPMNATVLINGLLIETAKKRDETQKQTKVSDYFSTENMELQ